MCHLSPTVHLAWAILACAVSTLSRIRPFSGAHIRLLDGPACLNIHSCKYSLYSICGAMIASSASLGLAAGNQALSSES
jgi:hypothetical protein